MVVNLRGTREARRCGIEGNAAMHGREDLPRREVGVGLEPVRDARLEVGVRVDSTHAGRSSDVA